MKHTFAMLATLATFAALAAIDLITLGYGESAEVSHPAKVLAVECRSTVAGGTYTPKRETVVMGERLDVTERAATNFTYSVVTTNSLGVATTNVLDRPHPVPYPPTMTGYWTNTVVTAWSTTNAVPVVAQAFTNGVEAGAYLAPGDVIFCPATNTFRGRLDIFVER